MKIQFYNNLSGVNILNKNLQLVGQPIEFTLKKDTNIIQPILILAGYVGGNYCYIKDFNRYYYVDDFNLLSNGHYEIYLTVDVLASYKDDLLNGGIKAETDDKKIIYLNNDEKYKDIIINNQYIVINSNH